MFTPFLFDHVFDIDTILRAFCGSDHNGRWLLNSRNGEITAEQENSNTITIQDGDDDNHMHVVPTLPSKAFINVLKTHPNLEDLSETEKDKLFAFLSSVSNSHEFLPFFENGGIAGGWLRERVKNEALDWLDSKNMIPPSMHRTWEASLVLNHNKNKAAQKTKVAISMN